MGFESTTALILFNFLRSLGQYRGGLLEDGVGAEHTIDCHAHKLGGEKQGEEEHVQAQCLLICTFYLQPGLASTVQQLTCTITPSLLVSHPIPPIFHSHLTPHPHSHP